jgi:hypothetical protein
VNKKPADKSNVRLSKKKRLRSKSSTESGVGAAGAFKDL